MPKFSNQAANADVMGEDAEGIPGGMPRAIGADGTPRDPSDRAPERAPQGNDSRESESKDADSKPGKNPGIGKDKDTAKP